MWLAIASSVLCRKKRISQFLFKKCFKICPTLVDIVFKRIIKIYPCQSRHLLWTLHYLKTTTASDEEIAIFLHTSKKSLVKHVIITLQKLIRVLPNVCKKQFN